MKINNVYRVYTHKPSLKWIGDFSELKDIEKYKDKYHSIFRIS